MFFSWATDNWFTLLQTLAILSSFAFTCVALRRDEKSRRISNLMLLTANHRDIWKHVFDRPKLRRVLATNPNLDTKPVTDDEALFVKMLILHLNSAHHAITSGLIITPEGLGADIRTFLAHPIARLVWDEIRDLQDRAFVEFVERHFQQENLSRDGTDQK